MQKSETDLNALARKLKRTYEKLRSKINPDFSVGPKYDNEWFKLARIVDSLHACPITYLEALFEDWEGTPFLNQLCSQKALHIYERYMERGKTVGELEFMNQVRCVNDAVSTYKKTHGGLDEILMLDFIRVKAYIRMLLCSTEKLPEIAEKYGETAVAELLSSPSVDKYIKENYVSRYRRLFPQKFSEETDSARPALPSPSDTTGVGKVYPRRRRPHYTSTDPRCS